MPATVQLCEAHNAAVVDDHVPVDEVALANGEQRVPARRKEGTSSDVKAILSLSTGGVPVHTLERA